MKLERNTSKYPLYGYSSQEADQYDVAGEEIDDGICTDFHGFGGQNSSFTIYTRWEDVERAIQKFSELGDPRAIGITKARKLAETIKDCLADTSTRAN